jgi:hypothetical protein
MNPTKKTSEWPSILCGILYGTIFVLGLLALALTQGCTIGAQPTGPAVWANATEDAVSIGLVPVFANNPAYVPVARSIAAALGTFEGGTLTNEDIAAFIAKTSLAEKDRKTVSALVTAAWGIYARRYQEGANAGTPPDAKLFIAAVARGINAAADATR